MDLEELNYLVSIEGFSAIPQHEDQSIVPRGSRFDQEEERIPELENC